MVVEWSLKISLLWMHQMFWSDYQRYSIKIFERSIKKNMFQMRNSNAKHGKLSSTKRSTSEFETIPTLKLSSSQRVKRPQVSYIRQ